MYLLDTDTVIYALKGQREVMRNLALHADDPLGVSVITLMELYYGAFRSRQVAGNLAKVRSLEKAVRVWDLEADAPAAAVSTTSTWASPPARWCTISRWSAGAARISRACAGCASTIGALRPANEPGAINR